MLIAQIFPIISVYCLRGGQYAYRGNVINFPQDVREFITRLPCHPSSLDVLVVRRHATSGSSYRDFQLKTNNRYYTNIIIDNEVLQSLPENGPIDTCLQQIQSIED
ncbi:2838_t:CDS:2 [Cetraspora pellucida]|uniref:2838_t:CDS:1 n=1 Tax=Cetraspora pellucida TaxID=1433469 RepID=A0A9N9IFT3_9GLOM|nr:2838_t:CDS:2 [Cetraspora pellucida]